MMSSQNSAKISKKDGKDKPFQEIFNMHVAKCIIVLKRLCANVQKLY